jgi:hypothetical protein
MFESTPTVNGLVSSCRRESNLRLGTARVLNLALQDDDNGTGLLQHGDKYNSGDPNSMLLDLLSGNASRVSAQARAMLPPLLPQQQTHL